MLRAAIVAVLAVSAVATPIRRDEVNNCSKCKTGAYVGSRCYDDLEKALSVARGKSVYVSGSMTVYDQIKLTSDTTIIGKSCTSRRPKIISRVNKKFDAIFHVGGRDDTSYHIEGIDFENAKGMSRLLRSKEYDEDEEEASDRKWSKMPAYNLDLVDITAEGFKTTARGGSAIFLQVAKKVNIVKSTFTKNTVADPGKEYYGGGGAVWIHEVPTGNSVTIEKSTFKDNFMEFEHGLGAAFLVAHTNGKVDVLDSQFFRNSASDGGAIHIARVNTSSIVNINSTFVKNEARESGWGSRGAALRFKYIHGTVNIDGYYIGNEASEGRGLIANNRIDTTGRVNISGVYMNNTCAQGGAIWDTHNSHKGRFTVKAGTLLFNNVSVKNPNYAIKLASDQTGVPNTYKSAEKIHKLDKDLLVTR